MKSDELKEIERIYQSALEISPEERSAFLEKTCSENAKLREEVESLLSFHQTSDDLISQTPESIAAEMFSEEVEQDFSGREIENYKILSKISKGGMGSVYLAEDKKLSRQVAIKLLNDEFSSDADRLKRFVLEAKTASALNHPNIITIYEIGEFEGSDFIVTEYIEGVTLRKKLEDIDLSQIDLLEIAIQIISALETAHNAGIIHRDIKPDNIMIRPDGLIKILDFGIAKLSKQKIKFDLKDKDLNHPITKTGILVGTANYMSPEQARGKNVDARTDIFSFGVVLYLMFSGKLPFEGETTSDIIASILKEEPKELNKFDKSLPPELEKIVRKSLAKEKDERFQTATEILEKLKKVKKDLEISEEFGNSNKFVKSEKAEQTRTEMTNLITGDTPKYSTKEEIEQLKTAKNAGRFTKKNYSSVFLTALGVLLFTIIGVTYWYFTSLNNEINSIAVMPFINETSDKDVEYLTDGITETLINNLSQIPALSVKSRNTVFRYKGKDLSPSEIGKELSVHAILLGRAFQKEEKVRVSFELIDTKYERVLWGETFDLDTENLLSIQRNIAKNVSAKLKPKLGKAEKQRVTKEYTTNAEAYEAYLKGRFYWNKREGDNFEKAIKHFEKAIEIDSNFALAWSGLADTYSLASFYTGMPEREAMFKAKSAAKKAIEIDSELAEAYVSLAGVLDNFEWKFEEAENNLNKAIELNPKYTNAYQWKTILLGKLGKYDEAIETAKKAIELEPFSLMANYRLASIYFFAERYDKASEQLGKTAELYPDVFIVKNLRAKILREKGKTQEAEKVLQEIIKEDGRKAHYLRVLATIYVKGGKDKEARKLLQEVLELKKKGKGEYWNIAEIYARLGEKEKAFEYLNKSFQERESSVLYTKRDINFESLRNTERFEEFLKKVGLSS